MSLETIITIIVTLGLGLLSLISAPIIYIGKTMVNRIEKLENEMDHRPTDQEVRILVEDKTTNLESKVEKMDSKLDQIYDFLLNKNK